MDKPMTKEEVVSGLLEKRQHYLVDSPTWILLNSAIQLIQSQPSEEYKEKLFNSHHICCNFHSRRVGDCNCVAIMKAEQSQPMSEQEIEKFLKEFPVPKGESKITLFHQLYGSIQYPDGGKNDEHRFFKDLAKTLFRERNKK